MAFGTRRQIGWVPAPTSGLEHTISRRLVNSERAYGPPSLRTSIQPYKTFNMTWTEQRANLQPLLDAVEFNDGPPYYFLHPSCLSIPGVNAFPAHWSAPGMALRDRGREALSNTYALMSDEAGTLYSGTVSRATTYRGAPKVGVHLETLVNAGPFPIVHDQVDGGAQTYNLKASGTAVVFNHYNPSATILLPPNYTILVSVAATSLNSGLKYKLAASADGSFTDVIRTVDSGTINLTDGTTAVTGPVDQWSMLDFAFSYINTPDTDIPWVDLYGLWGCMVPTSSIDTGNSATWPVFNWSLGRGTMPLFPADPNMTITTYQAFDRELTAITYPLSEGYIPW